MTTSTAAVSPAYGSGQPTTPKAVSSRLGTRNTTLRPMPDLVPPSLEVSGIDDRTITGRDLPRVRSGLTDDDWATDAEGRVTPVPVVDSSRSVSGSSSMPSDQSTSSPNSTSISSLSSQSQPGPSAKSTFNTLPVVPARIGLGNIQGEEQLKSALQAKDRFFLIVLSKEIEAFIRQVITGNAPSAALAVPIATASTSLLAGASFRMGSVASSKFQRMLVYKAAEWYGLKAVSTADGTMFIGVLGTIPEERLRLSELVPTPNEPSQKFQLMRRAQNSGDGPARAGNGVDDAADGARQTFEERSAAYAAARERILGSSNADGEISEDLAAIVEEEVRGRTRRQEPDEPDPVPRHTLGTLPAAYEHVYPSLYHPPIEETPPAPPPMDTAAMGYNYLTGQTYPLYPEANYAPPADPYSTPGPSYPMAYPSQGYGAPMPYMAQPDVAAWQQQSANSMASAPMGMAPMPRSPMMPPPQMMQPQQPWGYGHHMHNQVGLGNQNRQMPMIPQGMQYPQYSPYPPNVMYGQLHQPVPSRPNPQHHSSASSSISSRSYQDYSRPHSRGSTTSNRSATSSVRIGAMFPAGAGAGPSHRQAGIRGQGLNGMTSLGLRSERTSHRGHSPSSATTTSSRSSKKNASIVLAQPSQHPLPQRPDWAANNIPYRPAPMVEADHTPDTAEFPPLRQVVHAEPMQFERARTKTVSAPNQSVWNGSASKALANGGAAMPGSPQSAKTATLAPSTAKPITVIPAALVAAATASAAPSPPDSELPRRAAPLRTPASLVESASAKPISRPQSAARSTTPAAASAEDIEAKLAAVSLNVGIAIGPPPSVKSALANGANGANGATPSYAKIVRRD